MIDWGAINYHPNWVKKTFRTLLASAVALQTTLTEESIIIPKVLKINTTLESWMAISITVYGKPETSAKLQSVVNKFPTLWHDSGQANILVEDHITLLLIENWQMVYKAGQAKVYLLGEADWLVVNKTFNKLYNQNQMKWTSQLMPFTHPYFIIWKRLLNNGRKGRVVVNIWRLNQILISDAYSVSLQSEILADVSGTKFITTVDCSSFFY